MKAPQPSHVNHLFKLKPAWYGQFLQLGAATMLLGFFLVKGGVTDWLGLSNDFHAFFSLWDQYPILLVIIFFGLALYPWPRSPSLILEEEGVVMPRWSETVRIQYGDIIGLAKKLDVRTKKKIVRVFFEDRHGQVRGLGLGRELYRKRDVDLALAMIAKKTGLEWETVQFDWNLAGVWRQISKSTNNRMLAAWLMRNALTINPEAGNIESRTYLSLIHSARSIIFALPLTLAVLLAQTGSHLHFWIGVLVLVPGTMVINLLINGLQHLLRDHFQSQRALHRQISSAGCVQSNLLPNKIPSVDGYRLKAVYQPAGEVSGDYYDFIRLENGNHALVIGDVSGKGLTAGLYMTLVKGFTQMAFRHTNQPTQALAAINTEMRIQKNQNTFVSMAVAILSPQTGEVALVSAGHEPVIHWSKTKGISLINPEGIALGIGPQALFSRTCKSELLQLKKGEWLMLFTDGLTEAMNENNEPFGMHRLTELINSYNNQLPEQLCNLIQDRIADWRGSTPINDDLSFIILYRNL